MAQAHKFFIIRLSSIGDIILATPLVRCLRNAFPESQIDFLVKKEFAAVLSNNPHINNLITFDKNAEGELQRVKSLVKQNAYSHIIDIQENIRSVQMRSGAGAVVSDFSKQVFNRFMLIRLKWNLYKTSKPVYLRYFEAVEKLDVTYDGLGTEVFPAPSDIEKVQALLPDFAKNKKIIAVAPGAHWENKRWMPEGFAAAAGIIAKKEDAVVMLIGGQGDTDICLQVQQQTDADTVNLAGKLSLMESAAALKQASLLIANDTGMLHMAQAVKTPVVAIFGPTTRELGFSPLPEKSQVAEVTLSCRPCTQKGMNICPKGHHNCMKLVSPQTVAKLGLEIVE